jgi:hypothetical protein
MPEALSKLVFKPGVNRDQTNYASEGGWYECDKIRFRSGYPEKIGGWTVSNFTQYQGVCRSLYPYTALNTTTNKAVSLNGIGTNSEIYVQYGTSLTNITPVRATYTHSTTPSTDNCISTAASSTTVTVTLTSHGANAGDFVTLSGVSGPIGGVDASYFNQTFSIVSVTANTFTINLSITPTTSPVYPSAATNAGGTAITIAFKIYSGFASITAGYGWGAGTWNSGTWGRGGDVPIYNPARLIFQGQFNDGVTFNSALFFNIRDAKGSDLYGSGTQTNIFYWNYDATYTTVAVPLTSASGAVAVPRQVGQILFTPSNFLLALGCTVYDVTNSGGDYVGVYDPLLIRWSNVDPVYGPQPQIWQPTTINTAGDLRVKNGSRIITGFNTRQETLVFTDFSVNSLQFLGTSDVFGITEIDSNISIMGPNVVISANNVVYWMGANKFHSYSGRVDTLPCTLRQYVFQSPGLIQSLSDLFFAGSNSQFNEIIWFYASNNQDDPSNPVVNTYVIYNYLEQIWYYGKLSRTAWTDLGWPTNPIAAQDGTIYNQEDGTNDCRFGGVTLPITSYIKSADMDIGDGYKYTLIRKIIPDVNFNNSTATNPSAYITVGVRNFPGATQATTNAEGQTLTRNVIVGQQQQGGTITTATVDQYTNQVYLRARGRQMSFTIGSTDLGVQWQLGAVRMEGREDGRRSGEAV